MSFSIKTIPEFDRQLKRLSKKYPSMAADLVALADTLRDNPIQGTVIGANCYKIRIAIASKNKGKSGGGRVITNVLVEADTVYLLSIYDKSEAESISDKELKGLLAAIPAPGNDANGVSE